MQQLRTLSFVKDKKIGLNRVSVISLLEKIILHKKEDIYVI